MRMPLKYLAIAVAIAMCSVGAGFAAWQQIRDEDMQSAAIMAPSVDPTGLAPTPADEVAVSAESSAAVTAVPTRSTAGTTPAKSPKGVSSTKTGSSGTRSCTKPKFTTSDSDGGWSTAGYYVHNNMWNTDEAGPETLYACAYNNWYVTSAQPDSTSVKTYPNVHKDYNNVPISSFSSLHSSFAATSPHTGIYNVAYDIWLNGVAAAGSTEVMIWTENHRQRPSGSVVGATTLGWHRYKVWKTSDNSYIALVPSTPMTSGDIDLLSIFVYLRAKGWLSQNATLGQIDYGVEICSTGGKPATFRFSDFSITQS